MHASLTKPYVPLARDNGTLVLIDHQMGLMLTTQSVRLEELRRNTLGLARVAKLYGIPTVITSGGTQVPGGRGFNGPLFPDLMGGVSSDVCLTFATVAAADAGFEVYFVADVSTTWGTRAETAAMLRMSQRGVVMTNWSSVAAEIQADYVKHADTAEAFFGIMGEYNAAFQGVAMAIAANGGRLS